MTTDQKEALLHDLLEEGKPFSRLSDPERKVVIEEFGTEADYNAMLHFQDNMMSALEDEEELLPTTAMRKAVMGERRASAGFAVWLNGLWVFLWPPQQPVYRRPLLQFASVALLITGGWLVVQNVNLNDGEQMAEHDAAMDKKEKQEQPSAMVATDSVDGETGAGDEAGLSDAFAGTPAIEEVAKDRTVEKESDMIAEDMDFASDDEVADVVAATTVAPNPPGGFNQADGNPKGDALTDLDKSGNAAGSRKTVAAESRVARESAVQQPAKYKDLPSEPSTDELIDLLYTAY
jgi:hypothetical protein